MYKRKGENSFNKCNKETSKKMTFNEDSVLYKAFKTYQTELDTRNDKYERLVKLSRDITINSKRLIFTLLRKDGYLSTVLTEAEEKVKFLLNLIETIGVEVANEDIHRFVRAYSPGLQEFIEAVTLLHFRKSNTLISFEEVKKLYFFEYNILSPYDYMLGVADLTGELMRLAISSIGEGELELVDKICLLLRTIYNNFSVFMGCHGEISRKIRVMKASMQKVENACYTLKVRGSEMPTYLLLDKLVNATEEGTGN